MNNELNNMRHPAKIRIFWIAAYIIGIALFIYGMIFASTQIKTHIIPTGQVKLTVPYSKYQVGETISFTVKNDFNSSIFVFNNCPNEPLAVYRQENSKWVRQHDQASEKDCPSQKRKVSVPAGGTVSGNFAAWHNLFTKPGKYRVVTFVEYYNSLPYQDFEVVAKPEPASLTTPASVQQQTNQTSTPSVVRQSNPVQESDDDDEDEDKDENDD